MTRDLHGNMLQPHDYWMRLALAQARAAFEKDEKKNFEPLAQEDIKKRFLVPEKGEKTKQKVNAHTGMEVIEADDNLSFETYEKDEESKWIHKNYMTK